MISPRRTQLLIVIYFSLGGLFLALFFHHFLDFPGGNRAFFTGIGLLYFSFMTVGLQFLPKAFSVLSAINFGLGLCIIGYLVRSGWLEGQFSLAAVVISAASLGLYLSLESIRGLRGI